MLPEERRTQLDGIVQQMTANKEPDENIQAVVGDFKQKYSVQPPVDNRNLLQKFTGAVVDPFVTMASRPGELLGEGIAGIASKVTGNPDYYNKAIDAANQPQQVPIFGTNVKPINQETPESVVGEGIGTVGLGVGSPFVGGALLGASGAMQNNGSGGDVALNAIVGGVVGKVASVGIEAVAPIISKAIAKYGSEAIQAFEKALPDYAKPYLNDFVSKTKSSLPFIPSSKLDTTPSYNKKLIGEGPAMIKLDNGTTMPRVNEGGIIKGRTLNPTQSEIDANSELIKTPSYKPNATNLEKYNAVQGEIPKTGQALDISLKNEGVLRPPKEIMKVVRDAVTEASQNSLLLQKTDPIVINYLRVAERAIQQSDGTLAGEWDIRKILDQAYDDAGGKYGNNKGLDQIHRASRNAILKDMATKAKNTEVVASMKKMTNLYNASDVLQDEARIEGGSGWERLANKHPSIKKFLPAVMEGVGLGGINHFIP